ncbi:hypothetical protein SBA2_130006 [Acidobacteriia bacterium SbA2]|nr:hypothetical protein SBA2_130006 [Acidobacteriia bacterium SbA2]
MGCVRTGDEESRNAMKTCRGRACPTLDGARSTQTGDGKPSPYNLWAKGTWSAGAPATAVFSNSRAAALLPHSNARRAFSS